MENGVSRIVDISNLKIAFRDYLRTNYRLLDIPDGITLEILINATYIKTPIYVNNSALKKELE